MKRKATSGKKLKAVPAAEAKRLPPPAEDPDAERKRQLGLFVTFFTAGVQSYLASFGIDPSRVTVDVAVKIAPS